MSARWGANEWRKLRRMFYQGKSIPDIARALGRPRGTVKLYAYRTGLRATKRSGWTPKQVAKQLAVSEVTVIRWCYRGVFPEACQAHSAHDTWRITHDDLWAWLEDKRSWMVWQPQTLPDGAWREHFTYLRCEWFTPEDAGKLLGYSADGICWLRRQGRLTGERVGRYLWFHRSELERFKLAA